MLRFGAHVSCRLFRAEIALVLHHASQWSEIAGDVVTVIGIGELERENGLATPVDLAVELAIGEFEDGDGGRLAGYLARILAVPYAIALDRPLVRVQWDPRRAAAGVIPPAPDEPRPGA